MRAFLLAAGAGNRMRPLTSNRPKPLLPVAGKPFLQHILERVRSSGIEAATILIGWRGRRLKEYFRHGDSLGLPLDYAEQEVLEGTGAAVALAEGHVDSRFLCLNGDIIFHVKDLQEMIRRHGRGDSTVIAVAKTERPESFGSVQVKDERLVSIEEKPTKAASPWVNAGIYLLNDTIFDLIRKTPRSPRGEYEITDTLKLLLKKEDTLVHRLKRPWLDVGYPWDLLKANEVLLESLKGQVEGDVEEDAVLRGPVKVAKGATVRSGAYLEGPVYLDEGSDVGPNCYIRPSTYIGKGCRVGNACEVKNSIIMRKSHIPHQNYVGDSIVGVGCNFGSGTKVANQRLDGGTISVMVKGRRIDTGLRKLGAIMGDRVKTGINVSIDVGTIIGEDTSIGPGAEVRGNVAPGSRIY
ncbi:MAG: bifunctional sugar-1-phosphate nucleotidylyltransferase/acetyltransferase [Thermoplasmata archaeon]